MNFAYKSRYDRTFQQITHKKEKSAINYIKRFQNAQALSVSLVNSYSEEKIMHTFLDIRWMTKDRKSVVSSNV